VQEVYLEAWKSFHRFEPGTNCRGWLFKILFHRLHHLRRRLIKASKLEAFPNPADEDNLMAEPPVAQEIRDDDIFSWLRCQPKSDIGFWSGMSKGAAGYDIGGKSHAETEVERWP
jgi:DNA-directed RNA polymerase specialized sigma24 family protein